VTERSWFDEAPEIYDRVLPRYPPALFVVPPEYEEVAASGLFEAARLLRYGWDQRYSTADYGDLLRTYADTQRVDPGAREALIAELSALIDAEFDGHVVRPLVITLVLAKAA
jgi:hypothetical protein